MISFASVTTPQHWDYIFVVYILIHRDDVITMYMSNHLIKFLYVLVVYSVTYGVEQ